MTWIEIHFFLVVFINCRTPKLLQRQVVCYLLGHLPLKYSWICSWFSQQQRHNLGIPTITFLA